MPIKPLMSWEGEPNFRWVKMYKGARHRVTCLELKARPTKDGSVVEANAWWLGKKLALDGPPKKSREQQLVEEIHEEYRAGVRDAEESYILYDAVSEAPKSPIDFFEEVIAAGATAIASTKAREANRSVGANVTAFLDEIQKTMRPLSYREIRLYVRSLIAPGGLLPADDDVRIIDEAFVSKAYKSLRDSDLSDGVKKKRLGFFRRFVDYLYSQKLIDLPRNLKHKSHKFTVAAKEIKKYEPEFVRAVLASIKPRFRLYALLGLNCGMTSADIGKLTHGMIDARKGTITRRRSKTGDNDDVPTVTYALWPETLALLDACKSSHPTLALTSTDGTPLWESRQDGEKTPQKDLIHQQFKRANIRPTQKTFRTIAATWLGGNEVFGRYTPHFLAHSPRSIGDRHYVAPSQELFDRALAWLRTRLYEALPDTSQQVS